MARLRVALPCLILVGCSGNSARPDPGTTETATAAVAKDPGATGSAASVTKRPPAPPLTKDDRPIDHSKFTLLNPYDATRGVIFASEDGGCHVYVRDKSKPIGPPGSFPPPTVVACPPLLLKPEWGHCLGPGTISINAAKDECICQPGSGDPPGPSYRVPCPS